MPKMDLDAIPALDRTDYPMPFAQDMVRRFSQRLGPIAGLADFGVSRVRLEPGGVSSQRHWHDDEDEFVVILSGEAVLVEDQGETAMCAGDCAVFLKGVANGHHLVNRSDRPCVFLAIGGPTDGDCHYPDIDLEWNGAKEIYTHKDGEPY